MLGILFITNENKMDENASVAEWLSEHPHITPFILALWKRKKRTRRSPQLTLSQFRNCPSKVKKIVQREADGIVSIE